MKTNPINNPNKTSKHIALILGFAGVVALAGTTISVLISTTVIDMMGSYFNFMVYLFSMSQSFCVTMLLANTSLILVNLQIRGRRYFKCMSIAVFLYLIYLAALLMGPFLNKAFDFGSSYLGSIIGILVSSSLLPLLIVRFAWISTRSNTERANGVMR